MALGIMAVLALSSDVLGLIHHTWMGGFGVVLVFTLTICMIPILAGRDSQSLDGCSQCPNCFSSQSGGSHSDHT